jgi:ABC-type nitrate/sulfonate/bicarbonate transport system substrate-binding protein
MSRRFDEANKGDGETGRKDNSEKDCEKTRGTDGNRLKEARVVVLDGGVVLIFADLTEQNTLIDALKKAGIRPDKVKFNPFCG